MLLESDRLAEARGALARTLRRGGLLARLRLLRVRDGTVRASQRRVRLNRDERGVTLARGLQGRDGGAQGRQLRVHDGLRERHGKRRDGLLRVAQREAGLRQLLRVVGLVDLERAALALRHALGQGLELPGAEVMEGRVRELHHELGVGIPAQLSGGEGQGGPAREERAEDAVVGSDGDEDGLAHFWFRSQFGSLIASDVLNLAAVTVESRTKLKFLSARFG